jgi:hypothetical protein
MATDSKLLTYRVRQIPVYIPHHELGSHLRRIVKYSGLLEDVRVRSLASSLEHAGGPSTRTATVTFGCRPELLAANKDEWVFTSYETGWSHNLIFDTHFRGFTPLNDVSADNHILEYDLTLRRPESIEY